MKTTLLFPVLTLVFLFFIGSCNMGSLKGVEVPKDKQDYIGTWQSAEILLIIHKNGQVSYERDSGGSHKTINAPIQQFVGNNFVVGAMGFNTTFVVSETPHQENGVWTMTVDGVKLVRE